MANSSVFLVNFLDFFSNFFDLGLVESSDLEPVDTERRQWNLKNLRNFRTLPKTKNNCKDTAQFQMVLLTTLFS